MIPKFRAWDTIDKKMIPWRRLLNGHNLRNVFMRPDMCNLKLMQSTGVKDENGVEIFEGDVVLADGVKKIVTFREQEHEENFGDLIYYIGFNVYTKMGYSLVIPVEYEVIGNIYENPELLEAE